MPSPRTALVASACLLAAFSLGGATAQNRLSGLGENPGRPSGRLYPLPEGVEIVGELRGMGDEGCPTPPGSRNLGQIGTGRAGVCGTFRNTGSTAKTIEFAEGLIILSVGDQDQHGTLVERVFAELSSSSDLTVCPKEEVTITFATYCLNHDKPFPGPEETYQLIVSDLTELKAIASAAQGKNLAALESTIQQFLDDFTDHKTSAADLDVLLKEIAAQPDLPGKRERHCPPPEPSRG